MTHIGELAAVGTVLSWTATALFFEAAGHRIGSLVVNLIRLVIAMAFFVPLSLVLHGRPFPFEATGQQWLWLSVSAVFGFLICDTALFRAFLVVGPRVAITLMSLVPPITAFIGWVVMGEVLAPIEWWGMAVTLTGVVMVVMDRRDLNGERRNRHLPLSGVALGLTAAVGQAIGLVFSKKGMGGVMDPFSATMIRVVVGIVGFSLLFTLIGWWPRVWKGLRNRHGLAFTTGGAFFGPFLGVSMSLVAVKHAESGVVATILALLPVSMIPAVIFLRKEHVSWQGWFGAALAVGGVGLMFLD